MKIFLRKSPAKPLQQEKEKEKVAGLYSCPLCNSSDIAMLPLYFAHSEEIGKFFRQYQKHQFIHNIFLYETFNIEDFACSNCGANDKDRLYALYFNKMLRENPSAKINLLDIAPTYQLTAFLKRTSQIQYRSMDLYMQNVDDKADISDMNIYSDEQFDFFICSHVLEHVPDDIKAMKELYRVLKTGGKGIAMVPINFGVAQTMEDPYGTDLSVRWKYFGQDDHVRMYAKQDFIARLQSVGFSVDLLSEDYFTPKTFEKAAIYSTSVLYIVSK